MPKRAPAIDELSDKFCTCLKITGGLGYGELIRRYEDLTGLKTRAAKNHLKTVTEGISSGRVADMTFYVRGRTRVFGRCDDKSFMDAKEAAEREPGLDKYQAYVHLGGLFQASPVRSEWTACPVSNKIVRTTIITMGVADFMECQECNWTHFLGVSPRMKDRRLYAWQIDPLANAREYEDAISTGFIGDPKTFRRQPSRIARIRKGGHYIGLWFRSSWDHDPMEDMKKWRIVRTPKSRRSQG